MPLQSFLPGPALLLVGSKQHVLDAGKGMAVFLKEGVHGGKDSDKPLIGVSYFRKSLDFIIGIVLVMAYFELFDEVFHDLHLSIALQYTTKFIAQSKNALLRRRMMKAA